MKRTKLNNDLTANNETAGVSDVPFRFGCTDDGQYGYILKEGGADTVHPFSVDSGESIEDLAIDISYAYLGYPSTHSRMVNGEVIAVYWFITSCLTHYVSRSWNRIYDFISTQRFVWIRHICTHSRNGLCTIS